MSRSEMEAEISEWRKLASDSLHIIANILDTRISATASESRHMQVMSDNKMALRIIESGMTDMLSRANVKEVA